MFKKVYIEISDVCHNNCSFCPSPQIANKKGRMPLWLFSKALEQVKPLSKRICLHVLGDPLEVANLADYVSLIKEKKLTIDLVTTAKFLRKHHYAMLIQPPFHQVSISLSAYFDRMNEFSFDFTKNLLNFCDFCLENHSDTFINLRIQSKFILNENKKMNELINALNTHFYATLSQNLHQSINEIKKSFINGIYPKNAKIRLARKILLNFKTSFEWKNMNADNRQKTCYGLREQIAILSNGEVVPCCIDYGGKISLGNVKDSSLDEILNSKMAMEIKNGFIKNLATHPHCISCTYPIGLS